MGSPEFERWRRSLAPEDLDLLDRRGCVAASIPTVVVQSGTGFGGNSLVPCLLEILANHALCWAVAAHFTVLEKDAAARDRPDRGHVMADEENRSADCATLSIRPRHLRWNSASPTASTSSMIRISGSRWAATGECEPDLHPARVTLDGCVEEILHSGELDDGVEIPVDL